MEWKPTEKPDATQCPGRFCWHWLSEGDLFAPGLHANHEEGLRRLQPIGAAHCGCSFGICRRSAPGRGGRDRYEPDEPELERAGLPWFYFLPSPDKIVDELRDRYIAESEALWGEKHWL